MRLGYAILIITIFVITVSCNSDNTSLHLKSDHQGPSKTFLREFAPFFDDSGKREFKWNTEQQVNLSSLENGYKGFQLRIWRSYALNDYEQFVELKDSNSTWKAQFITIYYEHIDPNDRKKLRITSEVREIFPKSGWKRFIRRLSKTDILDLPDYSNETYSVMDGDGVTVEFADSLRYRIYGYVNPQMHADTSLNAKKMMDILSLMENEFGLKEFVRADYTRYSVHDRNTY